MGRRELTGHVTSEECADWLVNTSNSSQEPIIKE
jgi:hypothetical protein